MGVPPSIWTTLLCSRAGWSKWLLGRHVITGGGSLVLMTMMMMMADFSFFVYTLFKLWLFTLCFSLAYIYIFFLPALAPWHKLPNVSLASEDKRCLVCFSHNWFSHLITNPSGERTRHQNKLLITQQWLLWWVSMRRRRGVVRTRVDNETWIIHYAADAKVSTLSANLVTLLDS